MLSSGRKRKTANIEKFNKLSTAYGNINKAIIEC